MRVAGWPVLLGVLVAGTAWADNVRVVAEKADLLDRPSAGGNAYMTVSQGAVLRVLAENAKWYSVAAPGSGEAVWLRRVQVETTTDAVPVVRPAASPVSAAARPSAGSTASASPSPVSAPSSRARRELPNLNKAATGGAAVAAGYGYHHSGFGLGLYYYFPPSGAFRAAVYGGAGYLPTLQSNDSSFSGGAFGGAGGLMLIYGGHHRGFLDLSYGLAEHDMTVRRTTFRGVTSVSETDAVIYGATFAGGYEYMNSDGFFIRPSVGVTRLSDLNIDGERWIPTLNISAGVKW